MNVALGVLGLEVGTTLKRRIEDERLKKLRNRDHWQYARYTHGLGLDDDRALRFLQDTCCPFQSEYQRFAISANGDSTQFFLDNGWFGRVDAEVLYSVLRRFKPHNVVEVGSGFSTRVMRLAINDGHLKTRVTSIDPSPNSEVSAYADQYVQASVEDIDADLIAELLDAGDVLFIDSSHTVKTGGDVPYLFLEVLPLLKPGVLIHIHDIFIPFDYPAEFVFEGWQWNEQYFVHAYLAYNQAFEILWPGSYVWKHRRDEIVRVIPTAIDKARPCSLWIRKLGR